MKQVIQNWECSRCKSEVKSKYHIMMNTCVCETCWCINIFKRHNKDNVIYINIDWEWPFQEYEKCILNNNK